MSVFGAPIFRLSIAASGQLLQFSPAVNCDGRPIIVHADVNFGYNDWMIGVKNW